MFRFPFNGRPAPRHMQYNERRKPAPEPSNPSMSYEDLMKNASFSPELSFLLAMTLKDGLRQSTMFDMLQSIEPHVSQSDKQAIHSILGARDMAENFKKETPNYSSNHGPSGLSDFNKLTRQQSLLNVLQKYASNDTSNMMRELQKSTEMQMNFERMNKRMSKLRNMDNASPEEMFEALSMFMPPEEQSQFRNMQNMMRMMGSMGSKQGFKPEDMMRFMSGMGGMNNNS